MKQPRRCPYCGKDFEPMTDNTWRNVFQIHLRCSVRHGFGTVLVPFAEKRAPDQPDFQ